MKLVDLPKDLLGEIVKHLSLIDQYNFSTVCHLFHNIVLSSCSFHRQKIHLIISKRQKIVPNYQLCWSKSIKQAVKCHLDKCDINWGLFLSARAGFRELVEFFTNKGADCNYGILGAAEGYHLKLVEFFIDMAEKYPVLGALHLEWGLRGAAKGGHFELVEFFIKKGASNLDMGTQGAAEGGHYELVKFFVKLAKNSINLDMAMQNAAKGDYWKIVEFLIDEGASNWNMGLQGAAEGGHFGLAEFFIEKGASNWDEGIKSADGHDKLKTFLKEKKNSIEQGMADAAYEGNKELVKVFIKRGAQNWEQGMQESAKGGHLKLIKFFEKKGACDYICAINCLPRLSKYIELFEYLQSKSNYGHLVDF